MLVAKSDFHLQQANVIYNMWPGLQKSTMWVQITQSYILLIPSNVDVGSHFCKLQKKVHKIL